MRTRVTVCFCIILVLSLCGNVYFWNKQSKLQPSHNDEFDIWKEPPVELKQRRTVMVIDSLLLQINLYETLTGNLPKDINLLLAPFDGDGPNWPLDCFGNTLVYETRTNESMLVSAGIDGIFGTEDDIVGRLSADGLSREVKSPVGNWSAADLCHASEDDRIYCRTNTWNGF